MVPKISFCIPTRNRGGFIGCCLESIVHQSGDTVEIVIVDGASTDNTASVISELQKTYSNIRYYYKATNGGVDADLAEAVELATGDYCWLMSSDDMLADGAVDQMLQEIETGCSVYLCNRIDCTKDMKAIGVQRWLPKIYEDRCFDLSSPNGLNDYLDAANTLGALFSYVPSVIVKRSAWLSVTDNQVFFGTNYAHVPRLVSLLRSGGGIKHISAAIVLCRMDNDSFSDKGLVHRYMIDYEGYLRIANKLFHDNKIVKQKFLNVVRKEHRWYRLLLLRSHMQGSQEWASHINLLRSFGYHRYLLAICGFIGGFKSVIMLAAHSKKAISRY